MLKEFLSKLTDDKAQNRQLIENEINTSLKDETKEAEVQLLNLYLGEYLNSDEKDLFFRETRPKTYLKLYDLVGKSISTKDFNKALQIIDSTLEYIVAQPSAPAPKGMEEDVKRYQFDSFAEMLVYSTQNPKENCMWVAKDEIAFLKVKSFCLIELKKFEEAKKVLESIGEKNPLDVSSLLELFEITKLQKDTKSGYEYLKQAFTKVWYIEDYARMIRAFGYYHLEQGEYEKAKAYYLLSLMYDSSVEADKFVSNELNIIKEKQGKDFKVPPPAESAKFMQENNLPYMLPQITEVTLMRTLKKLYELKTEAQKNNPTKVSYFETVINSFESNFKRVTLNKKELIDVVKTDVYTNNYMYANRFFRYSFTADKAFRQMPPEKLNQNPETRNILHFLYRANERNLVEGFPITIVIDKVFDEKATHESMSKEYIDRLTKNGFNVVKQEDVTLPAEIPATKLYVEKGAEKRTTYVYAIGPRAFGVVSCQVEYDGDINSSYLTEVVESWKYIEFSKNQLQEVLDKTYSGYHSLLVNGGMGKDKLIKFATEVEYMLARIVPIKKKEDPLWEITGRKLVVGYILQELKKNVSRDKFGFDTLRELLNNPEDLDEYFKNTDEVVGYYTKAALSSPDTTKASYISCAKEFLIEVEK